MAFPSGENYMNFTNILKSSTEYIKSFDIKSNHTNLNSNLKSKTKIRIILPNISIYMSKATSYIKRNSSAKNYVDCPPKYIERKRM